VTGRTFVVVVIDAIWSWLLHFIDGVEGVNSHWNILLENGQVYH
jgi:hypothetical protein